METDVTDKYKHRFHADGAYEKVKWNCPPPENAGMQCFISTDLHKIELIDFTIKQALAWAVHNGPIPLDGSDED